MTSVPHRAMAFTRRPDRQPPGRPMRGLRRHVRDSFLGTSTCTHLNDTLRSPEDIPALLKLADRYTTRERER